MTNFDPYQRWLGIPLEDQPPHLYQLLGIELFEDDPEIINAAAENSIAFIQQNAFGVELQQSQRVLKELAAASKYLLAPENKANYDRKLKIKMGLLRPESTSVKQSQSKTDHRTSVQSNDNRVPIPEQSDQKKLNLLGLEISYLMAGVSAVVFLSLIITFSIFLMGGDAEAESPVQTAVKKLPAESDKPASEAAGQINIHPDIKKNPASKKPVAALPKPAAPVPLPAEEFTGQFIVRADSVNKKLGKQLQDVIVDVIYQPGRKKSERVVLGTIKTDAKGQAQLPVKLTPQEQTGRFLVKLSRENETWERKLNNFPNELTQTLTIPVVTKPEYLNPSWIEQRLEQVNIDKLLEEYRDIDDPFVQSIRAALDLSQHILRDHPEALREQLQARLLNRLEPELTAFQIFSDQRIHLRSEWPTINQVGGSLLRTIGIHSGGVNCLAITPDGKYAVSGGDDRLIKVWDLSSQTLASTFKGHKREVYCLSLTPDGKQIISGSNDRTIKVWDFKSGKLLQTLKGHTSSVLQLDVSPDGKIAVSTSHDKQLKFWDLTTGKMIRSIPAKKFGFGSITIPSNGNQVFTGVGTSLVSYNLETGRKSGTIKSETYEFQKITTTPDGKYAITGKNPPRVWDLSSGKVIRTLENHPGNISCMTVSPDGNQVIAGTNEREVVIWDFSSGNLAHIFNGHLDRVTSLSVSPDGNHLISGSNDTTLKLWNLRGSNQSSLTEKHGREVKSVIISRDGTQAVSGADTELKIWDLAENKLSREIKNKYSLEWLSYLPDEKFAISCLLFSLWNITID
ncbi:WD40 repeat domain-containing protein [uncultured Gimesia sp.]|uniref:WD40 repeat domain-containing protein n=1 Tax=uncultured Gimesia sp. TaxID=1678688 RepID=UPI00261BB872|nr:WD40 repeat domain-containing protein [uncultured Gimesia sp.]